MKRFSLRPPLPLALALMAGAITLARGGPPPPVPLPDDCMPLSQIRPGMMGEARTVIRGFALTPMKVEILGVEHGALPGGAMILARLDGPELEMHGIVAGMSGSPVYIDGKIIGAVAYGWSFAYRPYGGITPIENMMSVWDDLDKPLPADLAGGNGAGRGEGADASGPWNWQARWEDYQKGIDSSRPRIPVMLNPASPEAREVFGAEPLEMMPLSAPVFISRASDRSLGLFREAFARRGMELFPAGSSAGSQDRPGEPAPEIVAGSALGVPLMTGDVTMTSIGTVTYRRGNKLLAFGHPMFFEGAVDAPMSQAYIFGTMQSYARSFKLGETREIVGSIRQDRQFCIGGVFGPKPARAEVDVTVTGPAASSPRPFHFSLWKNRDFLPRMAAMALDESFSGAVAAGGELTADCDYTISLTDGRAVSKRLRSSSRMGVSSDFIQPLMQDMFLLVGNPFRSADVRSISINMDVREGFRFDALTRAVPRYTTLKAGESLDLDLVWQPYRGREYKTEASMRVPEHLPEGTYVVHLADAMTAMQIDMRHEPARFAPANFEQTLELAQRLDYPDNRLKIYLFEPQLGVGIRDQNLAGLPGSMRDVVAASAPSQVQSIVTGRRVDSRQIEFEYPVSGRTTLTIDIVRRLSR